MIDMANPEARAKALAHAHVRLSWALGKAMAAQVRAEMPPESHPPGPIRRAAYLMAALRRQEELDPSWER